MKILPPKTNWRTVLSLVLNLAFFVLIVAEVFLMYQLYLNLNNKNVSQSIKKHIVRVDFKLMDQAIQRYTKAQTYDPGTSPDSIGAADPFSNPVPIPVAH
ncbi:MAG: hypothetical protein JWO40_29 [Candidatus Doudnabacteria bacterium]|nr:hypothetical protein [Candidatus Doudnabacteria bacterium]